MADDDRTFRVDFTGEGADRLRERVKEKLKGFMGDYTDDTLVEYVVVLLRNGKRKDEARKELNVFLGDDCASFISWLWDHLSSNLHLYVQSKKPLLDDSVERKPTIATQSQRHNIQLASANDRLQTDPKYGRESLTSTSKNQHSRKMKGFMQEIVPFSSQIAVTDNVHSLERSYERPSLISHSPPRREAYRKRSRQDVPELTKRGATSQPLIDAPRRLLQFAVRDAVRTVQQASSRTEPALKRLRSVISASTSEPAGEERLKTGSVARVSGVPVVFKAATEDSEYGTMVRCTGNVFDRLGHDLEKTDTVNHSLDYGLYAPKRDSGVTGSSHMNYYQNGEPVGELAGNATTLDGDAEMTLDYALNDDSIREQYESEASFVTPETSFGHVNASFVRHQIPNVPSHVSSVHKGKDSVTLQYNVSQDAEEIVRKTGLSNQDPVATAPNSATRKIMNISANVDKWKPSDNENTSGATDRENQIAGEKSFTSAGKPIVQLLKDNSSISGKDNDVAQANVEKDWQKILASTPGSKNPGRPGDDIDSRTVFVSNVHFAATKHSLSCHFNKCGKVLKVNISKDDRTGQLKGSAVIEFLKKESAELALALNGTSFMSRILKVVRRNSALHEAVQVKRWPSIPRGSQFASRRGGPFSRGILAGAFRARAPLKPGARSLQWRRGAANVQTTVGTKNIQNASITSGSNILISTSRNLSYVRPKLKTDEISRSA